MQGMHKYTAGGIVPGPWRETTNVTEHNCDLRKEVSNNSLLCGGAVFFKGKGFTISRLKCAAATRFPIGMGLLQHTITDSLGEERRYEGGWFFCRIQDKLLAMLYVIVVDDKDHSNDPKHRKHAQSINPRFVGSVFILHDRGRIHLHERSDGRQSVSITVFPIQET